MSSSTIQSVVGFITACWAANQETQGRCRNAKCNGGGLCPTHQKMVDAGNCPPESPLPHVILFTRKISKSRADRLEKLGIKEEEGKDPVAKFEAVAASAKAQGRSAIVYDMGNTGRKDDGSLVFDTPGKQGQGAKMITVSKTMVDLRLGYDITSVHLEPSKNQDPHTRKLIVAFTARDSMVKPVCTPEVWKLVHEFFEGTFDVWVWANAPKPGTDVIVHTVNLGKIYQKAKPSDPEIVSGAHLRLDEEKRGAWWLEELPPAA